MRVELLHELLGGDDGLIRFAKHHGGTRVYVPTTQTAALDSVWALHSWMDEDGARRVAEEAGGRRVDVPTAQYVAQWLRRREVRSMLRAEPTMNNRAIARACSVSSRMVQRERKNLLRPDDRK